ncbi:hypothetical protein K523DRAFT_343112 [Schizophyllum commune Tattone D]|nr:hypothetical protein K523DRAFT_343112 [Schizophyllum commune Tattone D]
MPFTPVVAQQAFATDPKYKKYTQQVDKCLNSFDNVHDWADCIAFLKQLLKTFQTYNQFKEIPRKVIVAKRLAQCLNPALPNGVHQRALDVYSHILAVLGSEGLRRDLPLWSMGLFPFFEYAATSVKPTLLNLYDVHYLPLQGALRPVTKSFILALLPGLEEETGEFFEKVISLLDRLSGTVSPSFFFQNIWLVMLTSPASRGTSLNFLARRLPKFDTQEDMTHVVGRDIGLMIRAFAAALEDDNLLVRRGALDLLLQSMKIDSVAVTRAQPADRAILMRAAVSVVLRRDLALNRRLYTWLLGSDEKSETQIAHYKEHALGLLRQTLKEDMDAPSGEYPESRPFKIFISLLDKWEVGAPLTETLVYDALLDLKRLMQASHDPSSDIAMTASTLYEAVEPQILCKQLLGSITSEIIGDGKRTEAIQLTVFVLKSFAQDEEMQTIHLPILFAAIVDVIHMHLQEHHSKASSPAVREAMLLLEEMLQHIAHNSLLNRPELGDAMQEASVTERPYTYACTFYGTQAAFTVPEASTEFMSPFASVFGSFTALTEHLAKSASSEVAREVYSRMLLMLDELLELLSGPTKVSWNPDEWLSVALHVLEQESTNFTVVDRTVTLIASLCHAQTLEPTINIDSRPVMFKLMSKLLRYLRNDCAVYHVRTVSLIWALDEITPGSHIESIIAQTMTSPQNRNVQEAYEAFGILWRLTDDSLLPGFRFKVPMMIVLETLKSDDPSLRRIGETWMRCSLKSYLRVLDPILFDILDPGIRRSPSLTKIHGKELQSFMYERPFDQRYIQHLLDLLLSVMRFGGQGFAKTVRTTPVRRTPNADLIARLEKSGGDADTSYADVLIENFLRLLQAEPKKSLIPSMQTFNVAIQSTAVDLLQGIISRGDIDPLFVGVVEAAVIGKLFFCVHASRLDLQNKLLHLLHSLVSAAITPVQPRKAPSIIQGHSRGTDYNASMSAMSHAESEENTAYSVNPLLVQTLIDGISTPSNRPILQHWLDFILMAVPTFQPALQVVVNPLNECLCRQLSGSVRDVLDAAARGKNFAFDALSSSTDAEIVMLLNGLERLVLLSLAYMSESSSAEDDGMSPEKPTQESGGGLLGYVSGVFSSDSANAGADEQLTTQSPGYRALRDAVRVLHQLWSNFVWSQPEPSSSTDDSLSLIYTRTRLRCRRVLEHLYRVYPVEVFESIVECWMRERETDDPTMELVDVLFTSAQNVVSMICDSIATRVTMASDKARRAASNPAVTDAVLFKFLEQYLERLEGPLVLQVWGRYVQLVKDITGSSKEFKPQHYPGLRCITVLADKLTQTTAMEDRRVRKELQDSLGKLLDSNVMYVGRSYDSGSWIRRSTKDTLGTAGRESPRPDTKIDEKANASTISLNNEVAKATAPNELIVEITQYLASTALPNLRRYLLDNDKVVSACNNITYYIVSPATKGRARPMEVEDPIIAIIQEMSHIPAALKLWRAPVVELFNDNRFFSSSVETAEKWKPIVKSLFHSDKAAFPELLSKLAVAPSANIFTNKEYELLLRSLQLRRLSFALFCGDKNGFITQLPTIQEKLVETLKNVTAPIVQSEVYLCVRVLLCRLSPHNLTSFWPVLLTELYRLFESVMLNLPPDGSDDLPLLLAACKCLDLLVTLQTEEFQIHEWMFITDTVDAVYRPDDAFPEAMMDQLAEIAGALPAAATGSVGNGFFSPAGGVTSFNSSRPLRRPFLANIRQIESVRDLVPFFSNVSMASYESLYASNGAVDWEAVQKSLMEDMFDGHGTQ